MTAAPGLKPDPAPAVAPSREDNARRRSAAVVLAAALLAGAGVFADFGFWRSDKAAAIETSTAEAERRLAMLNTERTQAEAAFGELSRKRTEAERAIADGERRVAALDERHASLQRQVAELTGPVSAGPDAAPDEAKPPVPIPTAAPEAPQTAAAEDPSPPDEEPAAEPVTTATAEPVATPIDAPSVESVQAAAAPSGPVRVFIHVRSADPAARSRALAVAAELKRRGVDVADIRGVRLPIRRDAVRYFYDADREAVTALEAAVREASSLGAEAPQAQDFRSFRAPPRQGTLELWLS